MSEHAKPDKNILNKSIDVGALMIEDCRSFEKMNEKEILGKT